MNLHSQYLKLIDSLSSSQWSERTDALEKIKAINNFDVFFAIFREIEKRNDNNLRFQLLIVFEKLLQSNKADLCGVAIFALVFWKEKGSGALATKSSHIINEYIHSPNILRYLKIKSVRFAWQKLPRSKRHTLTEVISKNQLRELSRNLISNFSIRDEVLWIKTIRTLVRFRDKRVVRNAKKILLLNIPNDELTIECIHALGALGNVWDYRTIKKYLKHPSLSVQVITVRSFTRLTGNYGIGQLNKIISGDSNEKVKVEAITRLGRINTKRSSQALMRLLLKRLGGDLGLHVDWALHDIDNQIKVPMLIDCFFKTSDQNRMTILNFLADVYDTRIAPFILKILKSDEHEMIKVMAINLSSGFSSPEIIHMLENYILEFKGIISYTAMVELYEINKLANPVILTTFFQKSLPIDNLCHQVILKKLEDQDVSGPILEKIPDYIETFLHSERNDLKFLAIEISDKYVNDSIVTKLIDLGLNDLPENISEASKRALSKIVLEEPHYLSKMATFLSDEYFICALSDRDFTVPFVDKLSLLIDTTDIWPCVKLQKKLVSCLEAISIQHFDKIQNIDSFFSMMIKCGVEFRDFVLEDFLQNFYPLISLDNKKLLLEYIAHNPKSRYTDFFFNEVISQKTLPHLLNVYISNLSEAVNE